jgi:hypothetical protein
MSDRLKRILLIITFFIIVAILAFGMYVVFFRSTAPTAKPTITEQQGEGGVLPSSDKAGTRTGTGTGTTGDDGLPNAETIEDTETTTPSSATPKNTVLRESVVQQLTLSADGASARFYDPIDGKFYKAGTNGAIKTLSDKSYPNIDTVSWGNSTDQAILTYPDGSNIHVNFETGKQETLPAHWEDFQFSSQDDDIVAKTMTTSPESRYLVIAGPDGKNTRAIEPLGENASKAHSAWTPNDQIIAYATTGDAVGFDREQIVLIGKNHENYKSLLVEGRGFEPLWSPSGKWILYSAWNLSNGYRPELWVSGGSPGNLNDDRRKLDIQTWAKKCAWYTDRYIYCAVPESLSEGAGLDPDANKYIGKDRLVEIDLETGAITILGKPGGGLSIKNPVVTEDGENCLYTDASTGFLYTYRLN